jgi:hypothetical protein
VGSLPTRLTQKNESRLQTKTVVVCTDSKSANQLSETIRETCMIQSTKWLDNLCQNKDVTQALNQNFGFMFEGE